MAIARRDHIFQMGTTNCSTISFQYQFPEILRSIKKSGAGHLDRHRFIVLTQSVQLLR